MNKKTKVTLTYFKPSGKYKYDGEYESEKEHLFEIWDEVRALNPSPELTVKWDGPILVRSDHEHDHPHLIMP